MKETLYASNFNKSQILFLKTQQTSAHRPWQYGIKTIHTGNHYRHTSDKNYNCKQSLIRMNAYFTPLRIK